MKITSLLILSGIAVTFFGCGNPDDNSINIFSVEDDKQLGAQVNQEILSNPQEYPVLNESQYPTAYDYLTSIRDKILNGGKVYYKDEFVWEVRIIHDDNTLNAFCTPGGYIYVYTGLIKFLDSENALAGVLGHEIAHADRRHTTDQLTKAYGIQFLLDVLLGGNQGTLSEIAAGLTTLAFSRANETEADRYSVVYLCPTNYQADGAAVFFEELVNSGSTGGTPVFLSTHPDPGNRVQNIHDVEVELGCNGSSTFDQEYQDFKNSLP